MSDDTQPGPADDTAPGSADDAAPGSADDAAPGSADGTPEAGETTGGETAGGGGETAEGGPTDEGEARADAGTDTVEDPAAPAGDPLLSIEDLDAGYETGQVLFGVDLAVAEGELVSLLGRNGAGKTTTLRAVMGADQPRVLGGAIRYRGKNLVGRRSYKIAGEGIAFVPEERRVFPRLTVEENVRLAANHSKNPLPVEEVLAQFPELQDMRGKHARNTSGGEQQMIAIARALAKNPGLMLLDEPFEGLAPYIVRRIEDIVTEINREEGITVLFVEQNVAAAAAIADRHYVIDEGRIVDAVTTERLREDEEMRREYLGV